MTANMGIVWQSSPLTVERERVLHAYIDQHREFTGLLHFNVETQQYVICPLPHLDWDCLYFKAIEATGHTNQTDKVYVVVRGALKGWLSGQC
jgi:hypothetical protein